MNKSELVDRVAKDADVVKRDAERVLDAFVGTLRSAVKSGDKVTLPQLGSFSATHRRARTGRNPRTGVAVKIPASKAVKFSASSTWKEFLNKGAAKKAAPARRASSRTTRPSKAAPTRKR